MRVALLLSAAVICSACSESGAPARDAAIPDAPAADADRSSGIDLTSTEVGSARDGAGDRRASPDSSTGLPFAYVRPQVGTPVPAAELAAITDKYLDLLRKTRYLDFVDERVHGWPESDLKKRYWYGTWWVDLDIGRQAGKVSFVHNGNGDNNGIPTSAVLEGACFALKEWPSAGREHLVRRLIRGMSSWMMAMERQPNDPAAPLLARSAYPESITSTDGGRTFTIDYSKGRPGPDTYIEFVHIAASPHWGDLYIKNKRSKDDIGHMLRAIATLDDCSAGFGAATRTDQGAMRALYTKWCQRVETDGWGIATLDKNANVFMPPLTSTMSHFYGVGNAECDAMLAIRLLGHGNPGTFACGNGIHPFEWAAMTNDHNGEIVRSFHEAAVRQALIAGQPAIAQAMLPGLAQRIEEGITASDANKLPVWLSRESLADMVVHSANTGVPLTWREVRWVHKQIDEAHTTYVANTPAHLFRLFDPATPDGGYPSVPAEKGIHYTSLGLLLGSCGSRYRNPASQPLLDCARVKSWVP